MTGRFEIKMTERKGRGLFATTLIKKDEQILEFIGPIISLEEALQKSSEQKSNPLQIGPKEYIDIAEPGVLANHSCSPNSGIKNDRFLIALVDVLPGQEICYDYSTTMDEDNWTLNCVCGESSCRKVIRDFKDLPLEVQQKYCDLNIVQSFITEKLLVNVG